MGCLFAPSRRLLCYLPLLFICAACASPGRPPMEELSGNARAKYAAEDINGGFPGAVYIKTRTQTFNAYHYYLLKDGFIWYKSIDPAKKPADWTLFERTGLPHNKWKPGFVKTGAIAEIYADADELVALAEDGGFYRYCFDKIIANESNVWRDRWGWPEEGRLYLDPRTAKNRAWAMGKRNLHVLYYEDPFGNQHHNGTMEIATTYVLLEDGQEIGYADTGLPGDFSRNYLGPERGAFKAVSLSASASTMFLINEAGEMYTRIADFDIVGCDPMLFKYTYIPYTSNLPGTDYFSNLTEWGLPAEDWRAQPAIPLSGKAALTRHITILQNGYGNSARELRVAGLNEQGETGYWSKAIFADVWEFKQAPLFFSEEALLKTGPGARGERGPSPDKSFRGYWWNGDEPEAGWEYEIPNFNILEGSCDLRIKWQDETCALKLHPVELWTYLKRDYLPGRTGPPKMFFATLDIPENAFEGLSPEFTRRLREKFERNDKALFHYVITAADQYVFMLENNRPDQSLLLTDGSVSGYYPNFRRTWYIYNYDELRRYYSDELTFAGRRELTREDYRELRRKIELNRAFRDELYARVRELGKRKITALAFNAAYLPLDYVMKITYLNMIDVPKIHTITRFGERIVLTNAAFTDVITDTYIAVCEKLISLLEPRIRSFTGMAERFERGESSAVFPPWFSETVSGYWAAAGLPQTIAGTFFGPGQEAVRIPGVLSFRPAESGRGLLGWHFDVGENEPASLYIDPLKSAKTIYSRKGKTPEQRTLRLYTTLYVNEDMLKAGPSPAGGSDPAGGSLLPLLRVRGESLTARIMFDGETFEIREHPPRSANPVIFRAEIPE